MNEAIKLSPRLRCAASMVREGAFVADVGTDHAYLPIALALEGRIRGGVASDINRGPVERGRKNIVEHALGDKIAVIMTDGLSGIEQYAPDDILILGMGGELIARILSDAPWTKSQNIRLCLQPMTHAEILRSFLLSNGYSIIDEQLAEEDGRIYQLISAQYTEQSEAYTAAELLLGRINAQRCSDTFVRLARNTADTLLRRVRGKQSAGSDARAELELISEINSMISKERVL